MKRTNTKPDRHLWWCDFWGKRMVGFLYALIFMLWYVPGNFHILFVEPEFIAHFVFVFGLLFFITFGAQFTQWYDQMCGLYQTFWLTDENWQFSDLYVKCRRYLYERVVGLAIGIGLANCISVVLFFLLSTNDLIIVLPVFYIGSIAFCLWLNDPLVQSFEYILYVLE